MADPVRLRGGRYVPPGRDRDEGRESRAGDAGEHGHLGVVTPVRTVTGYWLTGVY